MRYQNDRAVFVLAGKRVLFPSWSIIFYSENFYTNLRKRWDKFRRTFRQFAFCANRKSYHFHPLLKNSLAIFFFFGRSVRALNLVVSYNPHSVLTFCLFDFLNHRQIPFSSHRNDILRANPTQKHSISIVRNTTK